MRWTIASLSCLLAFGLGCGSISDSSEPLSHAVAMLTCGPADGAATAIVLAREPIGSTVEPPLPNVRVVILRGVTEIGGHTFRVENEAGAWYQSGPDSFEIATAGTIHIDRVADDLTVHGVLDLHFPSRRVLSPFSAEWQQVAVLCG